VWLHVCAGQEYVHAYQPTLINLKVAKTLGLDVPLILPRQADGVIE